MERRVIFGDLRQNYFTKYIESLRLYLGYLPQELLLFHCDDTWLVYRNKYAPFFCNFLQNYWPSSYLAMFAVSFHTIEINNLQIPRHNVRAARGQLKKKKNTLWETKDVWRRLLLAQSRGGRVLLAHWLTRSAQPRSRSHPEFFGQISLSNN